MGKKREIRIGYIPGKRKFWKMTRAVRVRVCEEAMEEKRETESENENAALREKRKCM